MHHRISQNRILRPTPAAEFPDSDVIAMYDDVLNIVFFNDLYIDNENLFRRALFMDQPVLRFDPRTINSHDHVFRNFE